MRQVVKFWMAEEFLPIVNVWVTYVDMFLSIDFFFIFSACLYLCACVCEGLVAWKRVLIHTKKLGNPSNFMKIAITLCTL